MFRASHLGMREEGDGVDAAQVHDLEGLEVVLERVIRLIRV